MITNMYPASEGEVFGSFVARHVEGLRASGADVRVVANTDPRTGGRRGAFKYASLALRSLVAAARGADAVIGHYLYPTAAIARMAAAVARCPYALVAHGTDVDSAQRAGAIARAVRAALRHAALVVPVSAALERRLRVDLSLSPGSRTAVSHMGVDLAVFRPDPGARASLGWPEGERVALFAGNLVPAKGLDTLLEAFASLRERGACDRLVIVGAGPLAGDLVALAGARGVSESVTLAGALPQPELALRMAAADVFVLPSRSEGLGLVLLEAMACGTPCVASRVGGVPEALPEPDCGRLTPPDDALALAAAIEEVLAAGRGSFSEACVSAAAGAGSGEQADRFLRALEDALGWETS